MQFKPNDLKSYKKKSRQGSLVLPNLKENKDSRFRVEIVRYDFMLCALGLKTNKENSCISCIFFLYDIEVTENYYHYFNL